MAKFKFTRCPRRRRIKFFQSSPRYLNSNGTSYYESGRARRWSSEEPQSSDHKILTFTNGHYGIYFSLFNHELRKKENGYCYDDKRSILVVLPQLKVVEPMPEFHISKANQKIYNDINEIKSTLSGIGSQNSLRVMIPARTFSTANRTFYVQNSKLDPTQSNSKAAADQKQVAGEEKLAEEEHDQAEEEEDHFETSFANTQADIIVQTFQNHANSSELNVIFPLYQSLKRNDLLLPSIKEFNIVMKSIVMRSLDSEPTLPAIESKLTCLLTVYEDALRACTKNRNYAPDSETYNIIITSMFENISKAINLASEPVTTQHTFHNIVQKSHEFTVVGIKLLLSIKNIQSLALDEFLPNVLRCVNFFPNCINMDLAKLLASLKDSKDRTPAFYSQMVLASKHVSKPHLLNWSNKESYEFISGLYANFKERVSEQDSFKPCEYEVYCALVEGLISNGNLAVATKFVDQIILSFKDDRQTGKAQPQQVKDMSSLLSKYIDCLIMSGKVEDLNRASDLVSKFRELNYLPELDVNTHGNMIKVRIHHYITQEIEKQSNPSKHQEIEKVQSNVYQNILDHYNFIAIRKDFQKSISTAGSSGNGFLNISCKEALLSLALDIGDHATVSRLTKEILLKKDIIRDWNISKKMCQYLLNGAMAYNNQYYINVMWNFAEQQACHFKKDPVELHNFLSEHSDFLLYQTPSTLNKVLNSMMMYQAIKLFSIESCNAYGIISLMNFLIGQTSQVTDSHEAFKMLQYQSLMIQELEDTNNHYVELCPQLTELKPALINCFNELLANAPPGTPRSEDINLARSMVGGQDIEDVANGDISNADFKVDLSPQLIVNYDLGVKMFLNYFKDGYSFSDDTINAIISRDFVSNVLKRQNPIKVRDFLLRLFSANSCKNSSNSTQHLVSLINLGNEKVNLKVFECLTERDFEHILKQSEVLGSLSQFALATENKQFLRKFHSNIHKLKAICPDKKWVSMYLKKLISVGNYSEASDLLKKDYRYFAGDLNISSRVDEELLENVLTVFLRNKDLQLVDQIFKEQFSGAEGNKLLVKSEKFLSCFFEYYISIGSFGTILQHFTELSSKSPVLRQKIQFARYLAHLEGTEVKLPAAKYETADDLIISLINETNILHMRDIYESKQHLVRSKDKFFRDIVETLNKAASYSNDTNMFKIRSKLESMIKLCKAIDLTGLSCTTLSSIIKLLATTKSTDLLHILFNKFSNSNTLVSDLNFYFLHIEIRSPKEANSLLQSFKEALTGVGDNINLAVIEQMEQLNMDHGTP